MTHHQWILQWENREKIRIEDSEPHDQRRFDQYLEWLHRSTRTHFKMPYTETFIAGDSEDEDESEHEDAYDIATRGAPQVQRASLERMVVSNFT